MKSSELKNEIVAKIKAGDRRAVHIQGSPGIGKTQLVESIAKELGIGFKVIHAPLMQPEDYGFPIVNKDTNNVTFVVSRDKFPLESSDCPANGVLLIDELSQCGNSEQKILANLIQAREIHGQKLKAGWVVISTGNRMADRAGASRTLSHLRDRYTETELEPNLDDWVNWALDNGVKTEVISFVRFRPELLSAFDPQAEGKTPTPRAWVEGVSASLGVVSPANEFQFFKGDVGEGAAAEFVGFLKIYRNLPSIESVLTNPKGTKIPEEPSTLYALCGALSNKANDATFACIMEYVSRMPVEFSALFVRDALKRNPDLAASRDFIKWASGDGAKIFT